MTSPVGQTGLSVRHSGSRYVSGVSGGGAKGAVSIRDNWQLPPGRDMLYGAQSSLTENI